MPDDLIKWPKTNEWPKTGELLEMLSGDEPFIIKVIASEPRLQLTPEELVGSIKS